MRKGKGTLQGKAWAKTWIDSAWCACAPACELLGTQVAGMIVWGWKVGRPCLSLPALDLILHEMSLGWGEGEVDVAMKNSKLKYGLICILAESSWEPWKMDLRQDGPMSPDSWYWPFGPAFSLPHYVASMTSAGSRYLEKALHDLPVLWASALWPNGHPFLYLMVTTLQFLGNDPISHSTGALKGGWFLLQALGVGVCPSFS